MRQPTEREQWFLDRIGKRVYRNKTTCKCKICENVADEGLIIDDEIHARYLYEMEGMYLMECHKLKYFDTKEDSINYQNQQP